MTVTHRKRYHQPEEISSEYILSDVQPHQLSSSFSRVSYVNAFLAVDEPGVSITCDSCRCDLTHSIRIKCADPVCETGDGVDICPGCFCHGKEFGKHKRGHAYRVVVCEPHHLSVYQI